MTIKRKFGYELDKIVDPAKKDKNGNPLAVLEIIDDNTVFLDSRKPTNNTYEAYFSYLIPIADRSKWTISIYGRAVAVKFIPPRIERKI